MMIPYSFRLGRKAYDIRSVRKLPSGHVGEVHFDLGVLKLAWTGRGNKDRTPVQRAETFWHEVTHAILHDMGNPLWKNEQFVTQFSKRLNQVVQTAKLS